jgi:hypothetical protein
VIRVIDFCCDIGAYAFRPWPADDVEGTIELMDSHDIERAVAGATAAITYVSPHPANETLMADIQANDPGGRLVPYACLSPVYPGVEGDLEAATEMGFEGLKLYPNYHCYHPGDPPCVRLIRRAAEMNWPVIVTVRVEDERHHHPLMKVGAVDVEGVIHLARQVPETTIILSGANSRETPRFLEATADIPDTYVELSYIKSPLTAAKELVDEHGADRLLLGTHMPFVYPTCGILKITDADIAEDAKAQILSENAAAILDR